MTTDFLPCQYACLARSQPSSWRSSDSRSLHRWWWISHQGTQRSHLKKVWTTMWWRISQQIISCLHLISKTKQNEPFFFSTKTLQLFLCAVFDKFIKSCPSDLCHASCWRCVHSRTYLQLPEGQWVPASLQPLWRSSAGSEWGWTCAVCHTGSGQVWNSNQTSLMLQQSPLFSPSLSLSVHVCVCKGMWCRGLGCVCVCWGGGGGGGAHMNGRSNSEQTTIIYN